MFVHIALNVFKNMLTCRNIKLTYFIEVDINKQGTGWHIRYGHVEHVFFFSGTEIICTKMYLDLVLP